MRDALGRVQSVLVLGGTSEIGLATARALVAGRTRTVVLAVRNPERARPTAEALRAAGATTVEVVRFDALDVASHPTLIADVAAQVGDIDLVLLAFGVLGRQEDFDADPAAAAALVEVNYVGAVSCGLSVAQQFRRQGHGTLVVLSSVAGERVRRTNFVYGSAKAGLDGFAQGLGDALVGSGGRVMIVRPGFVHGRMTAGMPPQPLATTPEAVAAAVVTGLERQRDVVWVPGLLRWAFVVLRHLPRGLWRLISAR